MVKSFGQKQTNHQPILSRFGLYFQMPYLGLISRIRSPARGNRRADARVLFNRVTLCLRWFVPRTPSVLPRSHAVQALAGKARLVLDLKLLTLGVGKKGPGLNNLRGVRASLMGYLSVGIGVRIRGVAGAMNPHGRGVIGRPGERFGGGGARLTRRRSAPPEDPGAGGPLNKAGGDRVSSERKWI